MPATGRKQKVRATVRRDGKCRTCRSDRPQSSVNEKDPFCTSECCKSYYGVTMNSSAQSRLR